MTTTRAAAAASNGDDAAVPADSNVAPAPVAAGPAAPDVAPNVTSTPVPMPPEIPLFKPAMMETLKAPVLKAMSRASIVKFYTEYDTYRLTAQRSNMTAPKRMVECLDPMLRETICELYLGNEDPLQLSEEKLKEILQGELNMEVNYTEDGIQKMFKGIKMDLSITDARARVISYMTEFRRKLKDCGLDRQLNSNDKTKAQWMKVALAGIRPLALRDIVQQKSKMEGIRGDPKAFFQLLAKWAPLQQMFHTETGKARDYMEGKRYLQEGRKRNRSTSGARTHEGKHETSGANGTWDESNAKKPRRSDSDDKKQRKLPCLICKATNHRTKDHRGATKEELDRVFSEYREQVHILRNLSITHLLEETPERQEALDAFLPKTEYHNNDNVHMHVKSFMFENIPTRRVKINSLVEAQYQADTGTGAPIVTRDIVDQLQVESYQLTESLSCSLPVEITNADSIINISGMTFLDFELETNAGPLVVRDVRCYIIDQPMKVPVLLGHSFLKDLGIDVDAQLANLARKNERDVDNHSPPECKSDTDEYDFEDEVCVGKTDASPIQEAINEMLKRAKAQGLNNEQYRKLREVVEDDEFKDIWRVKLGADPPAKVPPMYVRLKPGATPYKAANRRYPPLHRKFMRERLQELVDLDMVYRNNQSRFGSAVHVVPKTSPPKTTDDFRWTVDVRQVNQRTETIHWPMPNLEVITEHLSSAKMFARFDLMKGYWQMPLHEECQEIFSMVTDEGVYTPRRVIQGSSDAVMYFQSTMQEIFKDQLYKALMIWLDDILVYAENFDEFCTNLHYIFSVCVKIGLKLNPKKTALYETKTKFCGRIISPKGIEHDPERIEALVSMSEPKTAAELQKFLCALNWMRNSLPDFSRRSKVLRILLENKLSGTSRKSSQAARIPVEFTNEEHSCFQDLKDLVKNAVVLAHPNPDAEFCLFTDASDEGWGAVLFQLQEYNKEKHFDQQKCEPLAFLGGRFAHAQSRWSTPEKEAFAVVEAVQRLDYLLIRPKPFYLLTDHRNLEFIFAKNDNLRQATRHKIARWALALMGYNYIIEHIPGEKNLWADLLSRWGLPSRTMCIKNFPVVRPLDDPEFSFPTRQEIVECQSKENIKDRDDLSYNQYGEITHRDKLWIPENNEELLLRIFIVAHTGIAGHRGVASTTRVIQKFCSCRNLRTKILKYCKECLLCLQTKGGHTIRRPLGRTIQAQKPNEVLHMDFYFVGGAYNGWKYILVMKDGASHFVELIGCDGATSDVVVEALMDWFKRYGNVPIWVSDNGSHFKNQVLSRFLERTARQHHFTTAYCAWANGPVERVNRELTALFRVILAEFKLPFESWPTVLPVVQYILNQTPTESLAGYAPIQLFIGREPTPPIVEIFDQNTVEYCTVPLSSDKLHEHYDLLRKRLEDMHQEAEEASKKIHERNKRQTKKAKAAEFHIGDYVLWSRVDSQSTFPKLTFIWRGPFQVVDILSEHVYRVKHLVTEKEYSVHATRLKFYHDASLDKNTELLEHISDQGFYYEIEEYKDLRYNPEMKSWELLVSWSGIEEFEDTWEPLLNMWKDNPKGVFQYLSAYENRTLVKKMIRKLQAKLLRTAKKHKLDLQLLKN